MALGRQASRDGATSSAALPSPVDEYQPLLSPVDGRVPAVAVTYAHSASIVMVFGLVFVRSEPSLQLSSAGLTVVLGSWLLPCRTCRGAL